VNLGGPIVDATGGTGASYDDLFGDPGTAGDGLLPYEFGYVNFFQGLIPFAASGAGATFQQVTTNLTRAPHPWEITFGAWTSDSAGTVGVSPAGFTAWWAGGGPTNQNFHLSGTYTGGVYVGVTIILETLI